MVINLWQNDAGRHAMAEEPDIQAALRAANFPEPHFEGYEVLALRKGAGSKPPCRRTDRKTRLEPSSSSSLPGAGTLDAMSAAELKPPADGFTSRYPDTRFDALLVVSFGGPEGMDDVMPFLENVTRGRNVPRERLEEVAHHYERFGGVSPINAQNRDLIAALEDRARRARDRAAGLPRQPQLASVPRGHAARDARRRRRARARVLHVGLQLVFGLPAVPRERVPGAGGDRARTPRGAEDCARSSTTPASSRRTPTVCAPRCGRSRRSDARRRISSFTAHRSRRRWRERVPIRRRSCRRVGRLVAEAVGAAETALVYQSRSGPPHGAVARARTCSTICASSRERGVEDVVLSPIGFVSDHIEVLFDLDVEAGGARRGARA